MDSSLEILQSPRGSASQGCRRFRLSLVAVTIFWTACLLGNASAAFVPFTNCLQQSIVESKNPKVLQFVPLNVTAVFNTSAPSHNLNVTVYGNVTGQQTSATYPPPYDPSWSDPNSTYGKIVDLSVSGNKYTTLFTRYNILSYTAYNAPAARFCNTTIDQQCPMGPAFYANSTQLEVLPAFSVAHQMYSSYAFTSITTQMRIQSGDDDGQYYSCVSATVTPDLGEYLKGLVRYLPLAVLILVGVATIMAAILSPWGSGDIFQWTSNFGRDEDLLRLVTPGFGDCLQYLQFVVLTGSLSLNYPGFFQPVVSQVGWSSLMFNESLVSGGNGTQPIVDGIYEYRNVSDYGLDKMSQLIGMTAPKDMWADMMVWLVVIVAAVLTLTQLGFAFRWLYRQVTHVPAEDLRSKNGPFSVGNVVRIVLGYFLLPLVCISMFQLAIAKQGPSDSVALAAVVLVAVVAFSARLVFLFVRIRPRSFLFDDLLTLLTYGPIYNTYRDEASIFALVPIFINILRGIAIGAVQASGVAQVVLLAVSEIVFILSLNAMRPFPAATSMNIYHTIFSAVRLVIILLSIAFVPAIGVDDSSRGWIGYAILLFHACVLIFGFFLNAVQTLIEVLARLAGAGGQGDIAGSGPARGGLSKVFGMRQLSRRMPRRDKDAASRQSMASNAAMLTKMEPEAQSPEMDRMRSRSISASSTMLLDANRHAPGRMSQNIDGLSAGLTTPDGASTFSKRMTNRMSSSTTPGSIIGLPKQVEAKDPYYRPPRRNTMEALSTGESRPRFSGGDWAKATTTETAVEDAGEGSSTPAPAPAPTPTPAPAPPRDYFEDVTNELAYTKSKTDYAVREVDFYYGVRGPALSSGTRRLKTGPADPTGPVSSATGWFRGVFGNKQKEKNKGFEVVRSARAPPPGLIPPTSEPEPEPEPERGVQSPYRDNPVSPQPRRQGTVSRTRGLSEDWEDESVAAYSDDDDDATSIPTRTSERPPSLPLINAVGAIELPSRIGSEASKGSRGKQPRFRDFMPSVPAIPRKSSRRLSGPKEIATGLRMARLDPIPASPAAQRHSNISTSSSGRLPFASTQASPTKTKRYSTGAESTASSFMHVDDQENQPPGNRYIQHLRHSNSALGVHAPDIQGDRPSSVGFVQQHRASDHIYQSPESTVFEGAAAEILGRPSRYHT